MDQRFRVYINGVRETLTGDTFLYDTEFWNDAQNHVIGRQNYFNNSLPRCLHGRDSIYRWGTSHDATSFGEYNSKGIWIPKKYMTKVLLGTNGFYLTGQNADYLGYDYQSSTRSGTPNDFTANNLGSENKVLDSPTNNFPTLNLLNKYGSNVSLSDGNLTSTASSTSNDRGAKATQAVASGKWYFEVYFSASNADNNGAVAVSGSSEYNDIPGETTDPTGFRYGSVGNFKQNGSRGSVITNLLRLKIL